MHKSQYKFTKKKNKCDVTIKSIITQRAISRKKKKSGWNNKKKKKKKHQKRKKNWRKKESIDLEIMDNLKRIGERGGNEVRRNLFEN